METLKDLKKLGTDDFLAAVGLQTRRSAADYLLPVLGLFSAGIAVGLGLGLMFAPRPGRELRHELSRQVSAGKRRAANAISEVEETLPAPSN